MACGKCGSIKPQCGCKKPTYCGCASKVDFKCVVYDSCEELENLRGFKGKNLEEIIKNLNYILGDMKTQMSSLFLSTNVGGGARIFKGKNENDVYEFKTLESSSSVDVQEKPDSVRLRVKEEFVDLQVEKFMNSGDFNRLMTNIISEKWFEDELERILLKSDVLPHIIKNYQNEVWFRNMLEGVLTRLLSKDPSLIADAFNKAVKTGAIDICSTIKKCVGEVAPEPKPTPIDPPVDKVDTPPTTRDNTVRLSNRVNTKVTKSILLYSDIDLDPITHVRFKGDVSSLFTNSAMTTPYVSGTELPIDFELWFKAPNIDTESTTSIQYDVKANGKWST